MNDNKLSPLFRAIGSVFVVPLFAIIMLLAAVAILVAWPLIPVLAYLQSKAKEAKP